MKNLVHQSRLKHIDIRHQYVRELVSTSEVTFEYSSTNEINVDLLTKGIPRSKALSMHGKDRSPMTRDLIPSGSLRNQMVPNHSRNF